MSDTTIRRPIRWNSAQDTNVGMVREVNEDSIISLPDIQLWAVADGMGGYEAGNVASNMIVKSLTEITNKSSLNEFVDSVEDSLIDVNHRILEYADIMLDGRTLGSTIVTLAIKGHVGICLWAGDSRLYRFRNNNFIQLSRDHSQVEELVQQGFITPEEAEYHPDSNVITRAIGASPEVYIDINVFSVQLGDTFLLCSDGLYNMVSKDDISNTLSTLPLQDAVDSLIKQALDNGANDNVSVILVKGEPDAAYSTQVILQE
ncbi:MAG: serine/threonine-protein phosphatase [endosymbiont of Galathealinum brachiosum]|uniref:Serine/threonine-protein phosphatase n=1 Tax=endosymbiont of Galathealinum brachiosum TaxID=2200906 RepID=A0A370DHJ6_9GAMM|nr:MAG: serine/threonine-protein phosphatase [endosymbiont of Galathealinum brachiosum]